MKLPFVEVNFITPFDELLNSLPSTLTLSELEAIKSIDRDKLPKIGETMRFRTQDGMLFESTVLGYEVHNAPGENVSIGFDLSPLREVVE